MNFKILNIFISNTIITCSWGIRDIKDIPNGIQFKVNGLKFKGIVSVCFNRTDELVDIIFYDSNNKIIDERNDIIIENLIEIIDNRVEKIKEF